MREIKEICVCEKNLYTYQKINLKSLICWNCGRFYRSNGKISTIDINGREIASGKHEIDFAQIKF